MKTVKTLLAAAVVASTVATPAVAEIEVAASAAVANMYLWRGQDLSNGSPAVSGDITASLGGAYAGVWASSGDDTAGQEYDVYAGYGLELAGLTVDASVWTYVYPGDEELGEAGNLSEAVLSVGYGPFSVSYLDNIAGGSGYSYITVGAEMGKFSATVGMTDSDDVEDVSTDYVHLDISYAYNDNLSFTVSQVIDEDTDGTVEDDLHFVLSYSLPIGE